MEGSTQRDPCPSSFLSGISSSLRGQFPGAVKMLRGAVRFKPQEHAQGQAPYSSQPLTDMDIDCVCGEVGGWRAENIETRKS